MTRITSDHTDSLYDACALLQLLSQALSEGEITDNQAADMSWLLGSMKKHVGGILSLLERIQSDQEAGAGSASDLAIADEIEALERKLAKLKGGRA